VAPGDVAHRRRRTRIADDQSKELLKHIEDEDPLKSIESPSP
jgi:hypothetical protein